MHRCLLLAALASGFAFASGCRHKCCLNDPGRQPKPYLPTAPNSPFLLPPTNVPTSPGGPGAGIVPQVGPVSPGPSNFPPSVIGSPPAKPAPEVLLPDPIPGSPSSKSMFPPDTGSGVLGSPAKPSWQSPAPVAPATPVGLSGFVKVKDGVASGRKPTLDGFDSLKTAGYRTVAYLHPAGADVSAAKDVAAKKGLAFVAIETTPEKLAAGVEAFNQLLADRAARPLYVFDDDGVRAGALWYLHFRTAEAMSDDVARVRAKPLGLAEVSDDSRAFGLAIQRYLETH